MEKKAVEQEVVEKEAEVVAEESEEVGMVDFVGAIFSELVEVSRMLGELLEDVKKEREEEKKEKKEKKELDLGFKVGADLSMEKEKGVSPIARIFGNVR